MKSDLAILRQHAVGLRLWQTIRNSAAATTGSTTRGTGNWAVAWMFADRSSADGAGVMLRIIQRCFDRLRPQTVGKSAPKTSVLLVHVPMDRSDSKPLAVSDRAADQRTAPRQTTSAGQNDQPGGRDRPAQRSRSRATSRQPATQAGEAGLSGQGLFSPPVIHKLRRAGVRSCGDLLAADPRRVVKRIGAPDRWVVKIRRCQRAIRFARRFSDMTPHEALLLFATHRRSRVRLASESPGVLKRDLERLLLSSRGQKLAAGRPVPEIGRVRLWIREAQARQHGRQLETCQSRCPR